MIRASVLTFVAAALFSVLTACALDTPNTTSCAESSTLTEGTSANVEVLVRSKAGENYLASIDVNNGLYSGPVRTSEHGAGALTAVPVGDYQGTVRRTGDDLVLEVQDQSIPLHGPMGCD